MKPTQRETEAHLARSPEQALFGTDEESDGFSAHISTELTQLIRLPV